MKRHESIALTPTARVIFTVGRKAYIAAGGLAYSEDEIKPAHIAAFNAIAEWHDGKLDEIQPETCDE